MRISHVDPRYRKLVLNLGLMILAIGAFVGLGRFASAVAEPADKVCICHAAGLAGTTHFVTVCASRNAIFGQAGHFYEDGTPRAGHEEDYLGPCNEPSPPPSPSPGTN